MFVTLLYQTKTMETKEQLVNNIREWLKIDGEISQLRHQIKEKNNKKTAITKDLVEVMRKNEIDTIDINGGSLLYKKNVVKKGINSKTLPTILQHYFKNDSKMVDELTNFIMENREVQVKETIQKKIEKSLK
jgi:hypothetical protein